MTRIVPVGSDDEWFLHRSGVGQNAGVSDADAIAVALRQRWDDWKNARPAPIVDAAWLSQFHRREQAHRMATLLHSVTQSAQ